MYFVSFVAYFEIVASLFVYIVKRYKSVFSSTSCHFPFGNHTKTDIFPHNNQITFTAAVQLFASYRLAGDTKPILSWNREQRYYFYFILPYVVLVVYAYSFLTSALTPQVGTGVYTSQTNPFLFKISCRFVQICELAACSGAKYLYGANILKSAIRVF